MFVTRLLIQAVAAELRARGIDPRQLVDDSERVMADVESGTVALSGRQMQVAVERLCRIAGDPSIGLTLGLGAPDTMLHVIGHLMMNSETVHERFRVFERYASLFLKGIDWHFEERDQEGIFGFSKPQVDELTARFAADWILTFALRMGRQHARVPEGVPFELELAHAAPSYADRYAKVFGCPVHFDRPAYKLHFPRELLDIRHPHSDPTVSALLRQATDALYRDSTGVSSLTERVRQALFTLDALSTIDLEALSRSFGLSARSMRRKLAEEGQSLSDLVDEDRCRRAKEELRIHGEKLDVVAERLGYADANSFKRAFKRWTGQTPSAYRRSMRGRKHEET